MLEADIQWFAHSRATQQMCASNIINDSQCVCLFLFLLLLLLNSRNCETSFLSSSFALHLPSKQASKPKSKEHYCVIETPLVGGKLSPSSISLNSWPTEDRRRQRKLSSNSMAYSVVHDETPLISLLIKNEKWILHALCIMCYV